jgi:uncharacterized membrane protein
MTNEKHSSFSESQLWKRFITPLKTSLCHKLDLFIWGLFVIFAGQLGTIINIINRCYFHHCSFQQSLYADSVSGNFYTYSLALLSSALGSVFSMILLRKPQFRSISIVFCSILVFLVLFNAIFFWLYNVSGG